MLSITENITIKADINKIWAFITDLSKSLNYNRFHTNLELPSNYSIGRMKKFNIKGFDINNKRIKQLSKGIDSNKEFKKKDILKSKIFLTNKSFD